jgi:hypothetical protein
MSIAMPLTFLHVPELIQHLPETVVTKDQPYKKENRLERLARLHHNQNNNNNNNNHPQTILDQPVRVIFQRVVATIYDIYRDITTTSTSEYSLRKFIYILTEGDRMIYIGIFLILIGFF